jgi:hypothetical protein
LEESAVENIPEDRFIVYVRDLLRCDSKPESAELELVSCPSYEQAKWIRQELSGPHRKCIIRHVGPVGGGD